MQQVFLAVFGTKNIDIANLVQTMKLDKGLFVDEGKSDNANSGMSSHRSITQLIKQNDEKLTKYNRVENKTIFDLINEEIQEIRDKMKETSEE